MNKYPATTVGEFLRGTNCGRQGIFVPVGVGGGRMQQANYSGKDLGRSLSLKAATIDDDGQGRHYAWWV
jgi:hypothetical protein